MGQARSGGQILIDALRRQGTDHVFCVPGESYLAALDALYGRDDIRTVVCRHEGAAAMMADAYGKLTHRPGVCFVTRGPGATNAASGVHIAAQDSTPLVLFVGQIARGAAGREAFQEIEYRTMYGQIAKRVEQIEDPARIPEIVGRAFHTAVNGRAGPVVIALPEDMLAETAEVADVEGFRTAEAAPAPDDMRRLEQMLRDSARPLMIVGGRGWTPPTRDAVQTFAAAWDLRVAAAFRYQDRFDNNLDHYVGELGLGANPKLWAAVREADLLIVLGARLGELTTGNYTLIDIPRPRQRFVHITPGAEELGSVYYADLAIHAGPNRFAEALAGLGAPPPDPAWAALRRRLREDYLAWTDPTPAPGAVNLGEIVASWRELLPADVMISNGAGNYTAWIHRFHRYRELGGQLAPTSGSMGYGLPAAIAAKLVHPERPALALAGDGCFLMTGQELATAVRHDVAVVVVVVNNGMLGTIRMHQELRYPGRVIGTDLTNPDFCALARAYGAHAERVERTAQFAPALARALDAGGPALIELVVDPDAISSTRTLSEIQAEAGRD